MDDLREDGEAMGFIMDTEYNLGRVKESTEILSDDVVLEGLCNVGQEIQYSNKMPMVFYNSDILDFKRKLTFNVSLRS